MKKLFVGLCAASILIGTASALALPAKFDTPYIGNAYRKVFHYRDCPSVDQMNPENQVPLQSVDEARRNGFRPCKNCKP